MNDSLVVYRPSGRVRATTASTYPTLVKLEGARITIIDNTKPNFHAFAERLGAALTAEFGTTTERIVSKRAAAVPLAPADYDLIASQSQLVFAGSGD